ncbi:hypothetical protein FHW96_003749 [Novosphingobium sp. SG751A]|uniref:hypothetical protein n=1 Tax=Novosphingobium sp. SG751A TaxID=2587000 RepID=UPI001555EB07|nr:hypothetical protein [Novosphingobium sp. SG751A]NOW47569.1 hypothetical protein [Novosphingobium sp. SG751A]
MPEATSLNIGPSPLAALSGVRSADGLAGVAAQDGDAGGFQAMLASQSGQNAGQSPTQGIIQGVGQNIGRSPLTPPVIATMTALRNNAASITAAPLSTPSVIGSDVTPEAGTTPTNATLPTPNGNLPVGGKILPVRLAPEDSADALTDTLPDAASADWQEAAKPVVAQTMIWTPRLRKGVGDQGDQAAPEKADKKLDETGDDEGDDTSVSDTAAPATPAADTVAPATLGLGGGPAAIMLTIRPAARSAQGTPDVTDDTAGRSTPSRLSGVASSTIAPTTPATGPADAQSRAANAQPVDPAGMNVQDRTAAAASSATTATGTALPAGLPQWLGAQQAEVTVKESAAQIAPALSKTAVKAAKAPAQADLSASSPATRSDSETSDQVSAPSVSASPFSAASLHQPIHAAMQDASSPADTSAGSLAAAGSQPLIDTAARTAPSDNGASRDMSALVDRLVEARAAMRSGASTQWVQTSIQHAEFGRVALQIRQDGDSLSVAMASSDPDFAPAAQAALNASQSLLHPAAAIQSGADTSQNTGQDNRQQGQGNSPAFNGQSGGQANGQNQQSTRQQAPFADNQIAQQAQALRDAANAPSTVRTLSGRSGILA